MIARYKTAAKQCTSLLLIVLLWILASSCSKKVSYPAPSPILKTAIETFSNNKQLAFKFIIAEKQNVKSLDSLIGKDFKSFDQKWNGTKTTFIKKRASDPSFNKLEPIRIIEDSSLVAVHSRVIGDTLKFRWDILRIDNKQITQHWSNERDSIGLNPNKHSEIDGPTVPTELEKTANNRALIDQFINQCMIKEAGGAVKFFNFGLYIQHNRDVGDGLNGLLWAMLKMKLKGHTIKFKYNYHIVAEGNFVLSATEGYVGKEKNVFYDFFRIENNKIVEHWDIIAPVKDFIYFKE